MPIIAELEPLYGTFQRVDIQPNKLDKAILDTMPIIINTIDAKGKVTFNISPLIVKSLGYSEAEWQRNPHTLWSSILHRDDEMQVLTEYHIPIKEDETRILEYRVLSKDRETHWLRDTTRLTPAGILETTLLDVTSEKERELELEHLPVSVWFEDFSEIKQIVDEIIRTSSISDLILRLEEDSSFVHELAQKVRILNVNAATVHMHAILERDEFFEKGGVDRFLDDNSIPVFIGQIIAMAFGKKEFKSSKALKAKSDGTEIWVNIDWKVIPGHEQKYDNVAIVVSDVTREVELSNHDSLMEIYNHRFIDERMKAAFADAKRYDNKPLSFLMVDLDNFKGVNDNHGHIVGDKVLWATAQLIQCLIRSSDFVGRWGGEEWGIILANTTAAGAFNLAERIRLSARILLPKFLEISISNPLIEDKDEIIEMIKNFVSSIPKNYPLEYLESLIPDVTLESIAYGTSLSIGIANITPDTKSGSALIQVADEYLYQAKLTRNTTFPPQPLQSNE